MSSSPDVRGNSVERLKVEDLTVSSTEEEIPLEILDYSCTTVFEETVKDVEKFLLDTFQARNELAAFLFTPASPASSSSSSATPASVSASSLLSLSSEEGSQANPVGGSLGIGAAERSRSPLVIGENFPLGHRRGDATPVICVEVHVYDFQHPVGRQFCLPLFLLVKSMAQQSSYPDSESAYYLSILATAAGNVFGSQLALDIHGRVEPDSYACAPSLMATFAEGSSGPAWPLPSPHRAHPNCVPCFAPIGDPYKQTFTGCSPPLVLPFAEANKNNSTALSARDRAVLMLASQPTLATRFQASAYGQPPAGCQHLSDYLDLFQLQMGQRSRVHANDHDGVSVSVWKRFHLTIPWRFRLGNGEGGGACYTPGPFGARGAAQNPASATTTTWNEALERENEALLVLCGPHTHPFGTNAAPLEKLLVDFQWSHLRDFEAQENANRSYLNPFALSSTPNGKEVNRKCSIVARGLVQKEEDLRHLASGRVRDLVNLLLGRAEGCLATENAATGADAHAPDSASFSTGAHSLGTHTQAILTGSLQNAAAQTALIDKLWGSDEAAAGKGESGADDAAELQKRLLRLVEGVANAKDGRRESRSEPDHFKDIRRAYLPGSLLSRFAHLCTEEDSYNRLAAGDVFVLWQRCITELKYRVEHGANEGVASALDCIGLPPTEPAVDMTQPILVQKLQMLAYCLRTMLLQSQGGATSGLQKPTDGWDEDPHRTLDDEEDAAPTAPPSSRSLPCAMSGSEGLGGSMAGSLSTSSSPKRHLRLITDGEPLVVPPPLPRPPATSDTVLQRAKRLNELGTSAVGQATRAWLQSDSLYNDMCLFLFVNEAQHGRKVRFPDFIHWHSPRDFRQPPNGSPSANDNDYLSDRMQAGNGSPSSHVWMSLWQRAVPRSREQIITDCFRATEEAALVFHWMDTEMTESVLLLETANACVANTLHRLLCQRFVVASTTARQSQRGNSAAERRSSQSGIPANPAPTSVVAAVRAYARQRCSALTAQLEAASALFAATPRRMMGGISSMEFTGIANMFALALRGVDEIETSICSALAMECLLGKANAALPEGADVIKGLSSPHATQNDPSCLILSDHSIPLTSWAALVAERFSRPSDRVPRQMQARLTCMAERPLNTAPCFQQLVVEKLESGVLRLALALSQEVL